MQETRIPLIIKFKEPEINHSLENPFDFPKNLQELKYFYDIHNITSYRKYAKIIEYKTYYLFDEQKLKSHYLEDYEDSSKTLEDYNKNMIGSFRICLSKKKDIFERKYKDIFELISSIGGFITILNLAFLVLLKFFVNSLDNLRLLNSIKKKRIQNDNNNGNNIIKDFWKDNENIYNKLELSEIPIFGDEDKKKFFIISMVKIIKSKEFLIFIIIFAIIIFVAIFWMYFLLYILYFSLGLCSLVIFILICISLCQKCEIVFLIFFIANVLYIILVGILWCLLDQCSLKFFKDNKWTWISPLGELVLIIICVFCIYRKYKIEDDTNRFNENQPKIFPFAINKYINSNLNIDNLLEKEIINEN
jgi:hypothetical protein